MQRPQSQRTDPRREPARLVAVAIAATLVGPFVALGWQVLTDLCLEHLIEDALQELGEVAVAGKEALQRLLIQERAIAEQVERHTTLRAGQQRLRTVPGVGARVVLPVLVACERYHTLSGEQGTANGVVAYVGLDPQPYESGASVWQRARISSQGDRSLRARLYLGALGSLRGQNPFHAFSERLVARGKPKKLALVAAC